MMIRTIIGIPSTVILIVTMRKIGKTVLLDKQDGTFWSSFEPINDDDDDTTKLMGSTNGNTTLFKVTDPSDDEDAAAELWLDQLHIIGGGI
jgi:hypothetical protein